MDIASERYKDNTWTRLSQGVAMMAAGVKMPTSGECFGFHFQDTKFFAEINGDNYLDQICQNRDGSFQITLGSGATLLQDASTNKTLDGWCANVMQRYMGCFKDSAI